jgi:hypothetical protein
MLTGIISSLIAITTLVCLIAVASITCAGGQGQSHVIAEAFIAIMGCFGFGLVLSVD